MRFISRSRAYQFWARQEKVRVVNADGDKELIHSALVAQFSTSAGITPYEKSEAERLLNFTGRTLEEDEMTYTPIDDRLGVFDSVVAQGEQGWSDAERVLVEEELVGSNDNGFEFIMVKTPARPAPWANYDDLKGEKGAPITSIIVSIVENTGTNPDEVIAYERENANRLKVIEALEGLKAAQIEEPQDAPVEVPA